MSDNLFAITISHQVGSGGAYVGQKLSEHLDIPFIDREILKKVAEQLHLAEAELEHREERLTSFWQSFARTAEFIDPAKSLSADRYIPTDEELFQFECATIGRIAEEKSAIFIGRCGRYILRDHSRHVSILVHADAPARVKRLGELYRLSEDEATKMIQVNDRERTAYIRSLTKQNWLDARMYDLCVNTSSLGLDNTVKLVLACVEAKIHQFSRLAKAGRLG
jgi:cytidylate kinase